MTESYRTLISLRIAVILVIGFLVSRYLPDFRITIALVSLSIATIMMFIAAFIYGQKPWSRSIALIMILFAMAIGLYMRQEGNLHDHRLTGVDDQHQLILIADDYPRRYITTRVSASLLAVDSMSVDRGEVQLSIRPPMSIRPGDTIIATGYLSENVPTGDLHAFDYDQYLLDQGIGYQCYVPREVAIRPLSHYEGWQSIYFGWRGRAIDILRAHLSPENFGLAASMILGYRQELDRELSDQFADTGAIHILAVSGMHVGIVLFLLTIIMRSLPYIRRLSTLHRDLLSIPVLVVYVMLTGAAPSVLRATLLFVLWRLSHIQERDVSAINVWAAAASIMLIFRPFYLWDVGFQLSFMAVLSIIIFMPIIERLWHPPHWTLRWMWSVIAMSISAQLLIFPVSLYYFHQFPLLFPLSSIFAIFMAFLIIPTGFALLLLASTDISYWIALALDTFCSWLSTGVVWMSRWSRLTIDQIWLEQWELALLFAMLLLFMIFTLSAKKQFLFGGIGLFIIFLAAQTHSIYHTRSQYVVHHYRERCEAIDIFVGYDGYTDQTECDPRSREYFRMDHRIDAVYPLSNLCQYIQ